MSNSYTITKDSLNDALSFVDQCSAFCFDTKPAIKMLLYKLCGVPIKIYAPGDRVILSGPGISGKEEHIVSITGYSKTHNSIRFIGIRTGRKAGDSYKPFNLACEASGITREEIESHLDHQYTVHEEL